MEVLCDGNDLGRRGTYYKRIPSIRSTGNLTKEGAEIRLITQTPVSSFTAGYFDYVYNYKKYSFKEGIYNVRTAYIAKHLDEFNIEEYDRGWLRVRKNVMNAVLWIIKVSLKRIIK